MYWLYRKTLFFGYQYRKTFSVIYAEPNNQKFETLRKNKSFDYKYEGLRPTCPPLSQEKRNKFKQLFYSINKAIITVNSHLKEAHVPIKAHAGNSNFFRLL